MKKFVSNKTNKNNLFRVVNYNRNGNMINSFYPFYDGKIGIYIKNFNHYYSILFICGEFKAIDKNYLKRIKIYDKQ